ncbi:MAG TPA: ABC transporter permease [Dehalococcoidales bacterium]|nr:ABC transporter permease [Dehalococcoidales bacterium]
MGSYIVRRIIQSIVVILIVTIMVFVGMRLLPGDPIFMLINPNQLQFMTQEELDRIRQEAGLDRPMVVQYFSWIGGVFRGDLGNSILTREPVTDALAQRIPITAYLGGLAFLIAIIIGIPAGIISAIRRGTWLDTVVTTFANLGITVPIFWAGIMLMWLFAVRLKWLPTSGFTSPFDDFWLSTQRLIMPVFCLSVFAIAGNCRQARSSMLEVLRQDYIRTAWSKGLKERAVIIRHALKNSLIPIVTLAGMGIAGIFGGSVLIEQVFNIPGMGRLAIDALFQHDYTYVQGITLVMTGIVVFSNLVIDLTYGWLDPRIRYN